MTARYNTSISQEIEIIGTNSEWKEIATMIRNREGLLNLTGESGKGSYHNIADKIIVWNDMSETVKIIADKGRGIIQIRGGIEPLSRLQIFIEGFIENFQTGEHLHLDSFGNEDFIASDSSYLVVTMCNC